MSDARRILVLASRNPDKVRELGEICADGPWDVRSAADYPGLPEVVEDGTTILGNATRKAVVAAAFTGEIAVADDTSLCVRALNDLPDVFAARFAGPGATYADNCRLLSELMREVPDGFRHAVFQTAAVWVDPRPGAVDLAGAQAAADVRWMHDPFRRAVHFRDSGDADAYWDGLSDHRAVWADYRAVMGAPGVIPGADQARLAALLEGLCDSAGSAARGAMRLPDPRIWTASGPDDTAVPTRVSPDGLPADAPGRAACAPVWLELSSHGRLHGMITTSPAGRAGFGYDPVFRPDGLDRTLAQMEPGEKNALSHRGRALRRLLDAARKVYGPAA